MNATLLAQTVLNGLNIGTIYVLMALGFTLIFGIMKLVNFAHGEFTMAGGFVAYFLSISLGIPFLLAVPAAALIVATAALVLERWIYRPFYRHEHQGMIATLGLSMVMVYVAVILFDTHQRTIPPAFDRIFVVGEVILPADRLVVFAVAAAALLGFYGFIRFTRVGLAMRVVAQDLEIAQAQGINTVATYRTAFFISAGLAALAGALLAQLYVLSPFMGNTPLVKSFIVVILGGRRSIARAALGGLILGMSESFLGTFYGASVAQFVSFGAIMLLLILRPQGLLGKVVR